MSTLHTPREEKFKPYDAFIVGLSLLSVTNLILLFVVDSVPIAYTIGIIDYILSAFFLGDFIYRLVTTPHKQRYFLQEYGWADLLSVFPMPQFKVLRVIRLIKAWGIITRAGGTKIMQEFLKNRASGALYVILFLIILLLEFGSVGMLYAEQTNPSANITSASDAIWWTYVTITTVGYGDHFPTTNAGRLIGIVVMLVGVGLFGVVTGFIANKFLPTETEKDTSSIDALTAEVAELKKLLKKP
jgi:voltage-gated potassium channel